MKRPYLASRNHSRRFSLAGSTAGLDTAPACTTSAGVAWAGLKACTTRAGVVRAFRPAVAIASAMSATPANTRKRIRSSEVQPHRQLDDARRARRVGDADRGPEVRVDLRAGGVEPRGAIDVLELHLIEQIVDFHAQLRGPAAAQAG